MTEQRREGLTAIVVTLITIAAILAVGVLDTMVGAFSIVPLALAAVMLAQFVLTDPEPLELMRDPGRF